MTVLDIRYTQPNDPLLMIQVRGYKRPIKLSDIVLVEGQENYTYFHLKNGERVLCSRTLRLFEDTLLPHCFIRINKSMIINVCHVQEFSLDGTLILKLPNNQWYACSRRRSMGVKKAIISYH